MISPKHKPAFSSALAGLWVLCSLTGALAEDQPCINVIGAEANLTHNFCFEDCSSPVPNLAVYASNPYKDDKVLLLGNPTETFCSSEGINLYRPSRAESSRIDPATKLPSSAVTVAIVFKQAANTGDSGYPFYQKGRMTIQTNTFLGMRVKVYRGNSNHHLDYDNVYSTSEFVSVVATISGTEFITYKNGAALTASNGNPPDNTHDKLVKASLNGRATELGNNHFKGVIKSVAMWNRALSAAEVEALGTWPTTIGWDIAFLNVTADFDAQSADEVVASYEVSKGRAHAVLLSASRCDAAEGDREDVTPGLVAVAATSSEKNHTHEALALRYDFNESLIGSSNVWNATSGRIQFCQRLRLVLGNMTIAEDVREIGLNLTLDGSFNFTNDLDPETVEEADGAAALDGFLDAYKCDGASFDPDTSALGPNNDLYVCIKSLQDGVDIESIEAMTVDQAGITPFQAIAGGAALYPSLTATTYVEDDKVLVSTRLPIDAFDFEALDASISVSGKAVLKFDDGSGRRLQADVAAATVDGSAPESSEFELEVKLTSPGAGDYAYAASPAARVTGAVLPALGAVFAAVRAF